MNTHLLSKLLGIVLLLGLWTNSSAQTEEPTGLLGDNFSLESALEEFKKATSLDDFEKAINDEKNYVHNLDLNGDDKIDYISVNDHMDNDVHAIVISAAIDKNETQDIAVIEIKKDGDNSATLQIVGDEDLYGEGMIVEPFDMEGESDERGPSGTYKFSRIVINVWMWPSVRYIYGPSYVAYRSPFYWSYYPAWWRPWRPLGWTVWRPYRVRYAPVYRITPVRRISHARVIYTPHRKVSRTVTIKHNTSIAKARTYKVRTTTTTKVKAKKGDKTVKASKKTKTKKTKTKKTKVKGAKKSKKKGG